MNSSCARNAFDQGLNCIPWTIHKSNLSFQTTVNPSQTLLNIDFGQGAANILEVKVGFRLKPEHPRLAQLADTFFQPLTLTSDIFEAP